VSIESKDRDNSKLKITDLQNSTLKIEDLQTTSSFRWTSASRSHPGRVRPVNEDACLDQPEHELWAVADGMGGHSMGEFASRLAVHSLMDLPTPASLEQRVNAARERLQEANRHLRAEALRRKTPIIGTTIAALLAAGRRCACLWAGDSRIYRCNGTSLEQVTRDHSEAREAADAGVQGVEPPSNVITRAVGGTERLYLDLELRELHDGDHYLLCSDGLIKELSDAQIAVYLGRHEPRAACKAMIEQAAAGACIDNVTVVAVQFRAGS